MATIIPFHSEEEAVAIANDNDYGLGACVHTKDLERAHRIAGRLESGTVWVNGMGMSPTTPFGGFKRSGFGREMGMHALQLYTEVKNVYLSSE